MSLDAVRDLAADQLDLLTRTQARAAGVSDSALRWHLSRTWQVVLPGVIHVHRVPMTPEQRWVAALLYAGPDAALTGMTALARLGLSHADDGGVVRVLVPDPCATRRVLWVQISRTVVPYRPRGGLVRTVEPERAVVEAARSAVGDEQATAVVIESLQRRFVTLDALVSVNHRLGRRGSARAGRAIEAASDGAWSIPEHRVAELVAGSTVLPVMWCNPELHAGGRRLLTPDGWFDDVGLAVMVHSRAHHSGTAWAPTVERDGELTEHGIRVVPITPSTIARDPQRVLERIERAYLAAKATGGRPAVTARRLVP